MSELSTTLYEIHTECNTLEKSIKASQTLISDARDDDIHAINTMTRELQSLTQSIKQSSISLKICEASPEEPEETQGIKLKVDCETKLMRYINIRHRFLNIQVKHQKAVLANLWDSVVEPPDLSEWELEFCRDQKAQPCPEGDVVSGQIEYEALQTPHHPGLSVAPGQEASKPIWEEDVRSIRSGDSGKPINIEASVEDSDSQMSGDTRMAESVSPDTDQLSSYGEGPDPNIDWSHQTRQEINSWRMRHGRHARQAEQAISRWNKDTRSIIKAAFTLPPAEALKRLARQKDMAEQLLKRDSNISTESFRGPFSKERHHLRGLQSTKDLGDACRLMYETKFQASRCMERLQRQMRQNQTKESYNLTTTSNKPQLLPQTHPGSQRDAKSNSSSFPHGRIDTIDWPQTSQYGIKQYRSEIVKRTTLLEQRISKWNQVTETVLKAGPWLKLDKQQEEAKELEGLWLLLETEMAQGPPPSDQYQIYGSRPEIDLREAHNTMARILADITDTISRRGKGPNLPRPVQPSLQHRGLGQSGEKGLAHSAPKRHPQSSNFAWPQMSSDEMQKWKTNWSQRTMLLSTAIHKWNRGSEEIQKECKKVPTGDTLCRLETHIGEAQYLEDGLLRLDAELEKGPPLTESYGFDSKPLKQLDTAHIVMRSQLSKLNHIKGRVDQCLQGLKSLQPQSQDLGSNHVESLGETRPPAYARNKAYWARLRKQGRI